MGYYLPCKIADEARTIDYRFSVDHKQDGDLLRLKDNIKKINALHRAQVRRAAEEYGTERALEYLKYTKLYRVRLMPRGPRAVHAVANGLNPRAWDSFIPHKYAEYFDVYMGEDSHAMYMFRDQISNGITPGQQAAIAKAEDAIRQATWDQDKILRTMGLTKEYYTNDYGRHAYRWVVK